MREIQIQILHDLRSVALIIRELDGVRSRLDNAVATLIGDLDKIVKGDKYGIRSDWCDSSSQRNDKDTCKDKKQILETGEDGSDPKAT